MNLVQLVLACLLVVSSTIDAFSIHSEPCDFNGFQTHPKSCRKYIECVNGWTMVRKCPKGLQFNVDTNRCDWKRNVDCDHGQRLSDSVAVFNTDPPITKQPHPGDYCNFNNLRPDPTDCTKFLQCAHNDLYIMSCGPGTVFNARYQVCDWPYNVDCKDGHRPELTTAAPTDTPSTTQDVPTDPPLTTKVIPTDPPLKTTTTTNPPVTHVPHPGDHCNFTNLRPDPLVCTGFFVCNEHKLVYRSCGPQEVFSYQYQKCDWPYNVDCKDGHRPDVTTEAPGSIKTTTANPPVTNVPHQGDHCNFTNFRPYPFDCAVFMQCTEHKLELRDCSLGEVFSDQYQKCDWPYNVDCKDGHRPEVTTAPPTDPPLTTQDVPTDPPLTTKVIPTDPPLTTKVIPTNPPSTTKNVPTDPPLTTRVVPTDPPLKTTTTATTKTTTTTNPPVTHVPKPGDHCNFNNLRPYPLDCVRFMRCSQHKLVIKTCGPGTVFNDRYQICDWPKNVNCKNGHRW